MLLSHAAIGGSIQPGFPGMYIRGPPWRNCIKRLTRKENQKVSSLNLNIFDLILYCLTRALFFSSPIGMRKE